MKILSAQQLRNADAHTIKNEPISSIDLMERASETFVRAFENNFPSASQVAVFCGTGNNGGDGLAIARLLHQKGWTVDVFLVRFSEKCSPDNRVNQNRLRELGVSIKSIKSPDDFPKKIAPIAIDALVGTGISRPLEGLLKSVVAKINTLQTTTYSVDLPSGLFDRSDCSQHLESIIHADYTLTFQAPKRNFFLPEYAAVVGSWSVLDIGLSLDYIASLDVTETLTSPIYIRSILLQRSPFSHKGNFGHCALVCGSKSMLGAAILCTESALKSGTGLVTIFTPECGYEVLQTSCPEAMCITVGNEHWNKHMDLGKFTSCAFGPGIGQHPETKAALLATLKTCKNPVVLDADALNLLQESDLKELPSSSILTPHPKEFSRLFGSTKNHTERLDLLLQKAKTYGLTILLKGRHTAIALPNGSVFFNTSGNPGMAKGGSGDVLTGLIVGLLARGYSPENASILGVYLHGLSGDLAAKHVGMEGMTARDLIDYLPESFKVL